MSNEAKCYFCGSELNYSTTVGKWHCSNRDCEMLPTSEIPGSDSRQSNGKIVVMKGPKPEHVIPIATNDQLNRYPGGKNQDGVYQLIINQIPAHRKWVECCAGSAAITRRIKAAEERFCIEIDQQQCERLDISLPDSVFISCGNFMELLPLSDLTADSYFLFIDPPYMKSTRTGKQDIYRHEWSNEDHIAFLAWVVNVECPVLITHPVCEFYSYALKDWRFIDYTYQSRGGNRSDRIWMNYPEPKILHDYRYFGKDRTERQSLLRLSNRWKDRFSKLSPQVQGLIMASLQERFKAGNV